MAFLESIAVRIGLDPKEFRAGQRAVLKDLREIKRGLSDMGDGVSKVGDGFKTFGRTMTVVTGSLIAGAAAVFEITRASAQSADQAKATASALGLTIGQYGELAFAAKQSNLEAEDFASGYAKFNKLVIAAQRGDKEAVETFRRLGVRITQADGSFRDWNVTLFDSKGKALQSAQVLQQVAETFRLVKDGSDKSERAITLFSKSGTKFIPFLNEGAKGIRALGDEAHRLGLVFTKAQGDVGDDFGDALDRSKGSLEGLRNQIGLTIAPDITKLFDLFTAAVVRNRDAIVDLAVRGYTFARQTIVDFIAAFQGKDAEVTQKWVLDARDAIIQFGATVKEVFTFTKEIFEGVAKAINAVFGTDFDAKDIAIAAFAARVTGLFAIFGGSVEIIVGLGKALTGVVFLVGSLVTAIGAIPAAIVIGGVAAVAALVIYWDEIKGGFVAVYDFVVKLFGGIGAAIGTALKGARNFVSGLSGGDAGADVAPQRRAGGGPIRGPGGPTSDRVPVLASNGEFMMRAAAVKQWGLGVMQAMNNGLLPRLAEGGLVGAGAGGRPVNLNIDGQSFSLRGNDGAVEQITRYARKLALRAPNRAPSWSTKR